MKNNKKYEIIINKCDICGDSPAHYSKMADSVICSKCMGKMLFKHIRNGAIGIMAVGAIVIMFL